MNLHDFRFEVFRRLADHFVDCELHDDRIELAGACDVTFEKAFIGSEQKLKVLFSNEDGMFVFSTERIEPVKVARTILDYLRSQYPIDMEPALPDEEMALLPEDMIEAFEAKPLWEEMEYRKIPHCHFFEGGNCFQLDDYAPAWFIAGENDWQPAIANEMVCIRQGKKKIAGKDMVVIAVDGDVFAVEEKYLREVVFGPTGT